MTAMRLIFDPLLAAQQYLEAEREIHPRFADQRNLLGLLYLERGNPGAALAEFEQALEVNPDYLQARLNRMVALRRAEGRLDPATWNREALIEKLSNPERSLWTAWYLAQAGDMHGVKLALEGLGNEPRWQGLAGFALAVHAQTLGKAEFVKAGLEQAANAHALYRRLLDERGIGARQNLTGRIDLGTLQEEAGEKQAWYPSTAALDEYLGSLSAQAGAGELAERLYQNAFLRQGDEALYLVRSARVCLARGQEDDAVRELCRAIELDPTSVEARIALGFEYQSQGYQDEAAVQFEVAARLKPGYPDVQYNLGLLYEAQDRAEDAIRCYRSALELNPGYFPVRTSLARLLFLAGRHREALTEIDAIIATGLRSADLLVQRAECLLALEQAQEAVAVLEKAATVNPAYPRTYYVMGQAYRQTGLKRKAQEAWRQYLDTTRRWQDDKPLPDTGGRKVG